MTATLLTERHVAPKLLVDELAARATLRRQIARLEQRLADSTTELWHARALEPAAPGDNRGREPRLLMLAELEATRDALVDRVRAAEQRIHEFAESQVRARARLEAMLAEPGAHRYGV